jgi:hypothetical protein
VCHLRHVASPDEVRITREPDGETAVIEYAADNVGATHFKIGPALKGMTDAEVIERFNETIAVPTNRILLLRALVRHRSSPPEWLRT